MPLKLLTGKRTVTPWIAVIVVVITVNMFFILSLLSINDKELSQLNKNVELNNLVKVREDDDKNVQQVDNKQKDYNLYDNNNNDYNYDHFKKVAEMKYQDMQQDTGELARLPPNKSKVTSRKKSILKNHLNPIHETKVKVSEELDQETDSKLQNYSKTNDSKISYDGFYHLNEIDSDGNNVIKVIVLAYQRSGSTFTGELVSSGGSTMYAYEPLFPFRSHLGPQTNLTNGQEYAELLGDLLDCQPEVIKNFKSRGFAFFRAKPAGKKYFCRDANLRIMKTIRARNRFISQWIMQRPDIKIIHLIRDPRAIYDSVRRGRGMWSSKNRDYSLQCEYIREDMRMENLLGPQRYYRVRYEDLVSNIEVETKKMFTFMEKAMNSDVYDYIKKHTNATLDDKHRAGYLNTYRNNEFQPDLWKTKLSKMDILDIQTQCGDVLDKLGYDKL